MREHFTKLSNKQKALKAQTPIYPADIHVQKKQMTLMYTRSNLTHIVYLIPVHASSHNIQRENLLQQKRQNLNVVFVVVTHGHTTMASALPRARSATTAPNTITLPVCVTLEAKSKNNPTKIPPMQYGTIFDLHIQITTATVAVAKAQTATRMPSLSTKSKTGVTKQRNNVRFMQT